MSKRFNPFAFSLLFATLSGCGGMALETDPENGAGSPGESTTNSPPEIELQGDLMIEVAINSPYVEPGVTASDIEDGDLSHKVISDAGTVDTSKQGVYHVTYQVKDSRNASAKSKVRTVVVVPAESTDPDPVDPAPTDPIPPADPVVETPEEPGPVVETPDASVPTIRYFKLIGYGADRKPTEIQALDSGAVVDLAKLPMNSVNILAVSADQTKTGSVHFTLAGPVTINRYENNAIYTVAEEPANLDILAGGLAVGDYTLTATPYELPDMNGAKGASTVVTFTVSSGNDSEGTASQTPAITNVDFVAITDDSDQMVKIAAISEGAVVDLADVPVSLVNIVAGTEDVSKTGSVRFVLDGPVSIDRIENAPDYTMANATSHLTVGDQDQLPVGTYSLSITAYSEPDAAGVAGRTKTVNFEVVRSAPPAPPAPEEPTLAVADDYFTVADGSAEGLSVASNDTYVADSTTFAVATYPENGEMVMDLDGSFVYSPHDGFTGVDGFTYAATSGSVVKSGKASITVLPKAGTAKGFTPIKPSSDSRLVYVSSSSGSDSNTCLSASAPCKSLSAALSKTRAGMPDHVYLKRGDVWRGQVLEGIKSGRSTSEPAVVAFYGDSGPRPKLEHSDNFIHTFKRPITFKNVHIIGLHFDAYKLDTADPAFTGQSADHANLVFLMDNENVLLEDNLFDRLEIVIQGYDGYDPKNFTLRRNIFTGTYYNKSSFDRNSRPSNIYAANVDGLVLEENVIDHGGWHPTVPGAAANMFNHNVYLQASNNGNRVVVRNNIITRGASHGLQMRAGGVAEDNFFARNALGLLLGYGEVELKAGVKAHAINNVVTEGHSMVKGDKPCSGVNLCTPARWGIDFDVNGAADYMASGNIVSGVDNAHTSWATQFDNLVTKSIYIHGDPSPAVKMSANITWRWQTPTEGDGPNYADPGRTLADYNQSLGGDSSFEDFMKTVKSRGLQTWDERYTAKSINSYIRAGFQVRN